MRALYPGSFDPVTLGHVDLIRRGLKMFGELTVAVAVNADKRSIFSLEERLDLLRQSVDDGAIDVSSLHLESFDGLVVDYCRRHGFTMILRGLRNGTDLDYEYQMANSNAVLDGSIETVFLMASAEHSYLSSSLIKQIARYDGDVAGFVPAAVAEPLIERLRSS